MSFQRVFHEHLLPGWDTNIKHNGFLPFPFSSLLLFIPLIESVLSSGWNSLLVVIVGDVNSISGGGNEFSQTVLQRRSLTDRGRGEGEGGYGERVTLLLLINPRGKLASSVLLHSVLPKCFHPSTSHASLALLKNRRADGAPWKHHVYFCLFG